MSLLLWVTSKELCHEHRHDLLVALLTVRLKVLNTLTFIIKWGKRLEVHISVAFLRWFPLLSGLNNLHIDITTPLLSYSVGRLLRLSVRRRLIEVLVFGFGGSAFLVEVRWWKSKPLIVISSHRSVFLESLPAWVQWNYLDVIIPVSLLLLGNSFSEGFVSSW